VFPGALGIVSIAALTLLGGTLTTLMAGRGVGAGVTVAAILVLGAVKWLEGRRKK
jgi:hypothetical protein